MRGEIWTDNLSQPFGTKLVKLQIDLAERTVKYGFKVRWWWLPYYWCRMVWGTSKEGFEIQIITTPKASVEGLFDEEIH